MSVRVANAGLKVAVFSWSCRRPVRVAAKWLREEKGNAETLRSDRGRRRAQRFGEDGIGAEVDRKVDCGWAGRERNPSWLRGNMSDVSRKLDYCQEDNIKM
jgi:hypothetical protein